ncbi:unnamed protein product [Orchesella dallaii]|uniref:Ketoreductase domain-containing protein n=1 Tax=Orchesella dallaii TaxID=48710 RepID=A0ABP1RIE4_9HEXA
MSLNYSFKGKRVLITGGGQGIGRQLVQRFHDDGAVVLALDKNPETIAQLQKELPKVTAVAVDVTDWEATKKAIESFGAVDHIVNNAAVLIMQPLMEITKDVASTHFDINVLASINIVQTAAKGMIERGSGGTIVNISSIGARGAAEGSSMYAATKIAMEMLTKSMSLELGPHNIRANCVGPGLVDAPLARIKSPHMTRAIEKVLARNSIKRAIDTNEIADLVMFLLSPLSAMINGETVMIDGGFSANY